MGNISSQNSSGLLFLIFSGIYIFFNLRRYPVFINFFIFYSIVLLTSNLFGIILGTVNIIEINNIVFVTIFPTVSLIFIYTALTKGHIKIEFFILITFFFLMALMLIYFYYYYVILVISSIDNKELSQWNSSYAILVALPIGLLINNKAVKSILIFLSIIVVFSSLKRGGIVAMSLSLVFYFCVSLLHKKNKSFFKIIFQFIGLPVLVIGFLLLLTYLNNYFDVYDRFRNMRQDRGSGRLDIYMKVLFNFNNFSINELLLGRGLNGVSKTLGISAHNDYLEVLFDYGLFGFCALLLIFFKLISWNYKTIIGKFKYANVLTYSVCAFMVLTMISHVVIYSLFFIFVLIWGALLAIFFIDQKKVVKYS
jgi:hypothetical protein